MAASKPQTPDTIEREILLRLEKVGRTYTMGEVSVEVLRGIDMEILDGEILAIVGP